MNTHYLGLAVTLAALVPRVAPAQVEAQQPAAPRAASEAVQCARVQPVVNNIIGTAMSQLETARQSNNPTEMRAAVDHLQAALRDIRTQLAPCSEAAAATDPHAGHAATPAKPASAQPAVTDAESKPKPKPPAAKPDSHAGHTGAVAKPADPGVKRAAPATKAAPSTKPAAPSDSHAGHGTTGKSAADIKEGKAMDPVTGLMVDPATAPKTAYQGQTYYFSSEQSRKEFLENPAKFAKKPKG